MDIFKTKTPRDLVNDEHVANPRPGDYWHECYAPVCVILGVAAGCVIYCEHILNRPNNRWTWDLSKRSFQTLAEFSKRMHYESENLRHMCIYNVEPEHHKWVLDHLEDTP